MIGGHLPELAIVMVLALVVFGPRRLPEIGGALGRGIRDFKRGVSHLDDADDSHEQTGVAALPVTTSHDHDAH